MTNATVGDEMGDGTEPDAAEHDATDDVAEAAEAAEAADDDDAAPLNESLEARHWTKRPGLWAAIILVVAVLGVGVFGFIKYQQVSGELAQLRGNQADRDAAGQLAKDYALKSLNYTFEDPDAFFRAVEDGVSQSLKDKYVNAADVLTAVMLQAQVSSTGEVLAIDPVAQPDGSYRVVVSAHQTTRNLQNPTPKVSIILLEVAVNKVGDGWQVSDIGPKTGSRPPVAQQLPALEPPPVSESGAGPAPAGPSPPR